VTGQLVTQSVSSAGVATPIEKPYPIRSGSHTVLLPLAASEGTVNAVNIVGVPADANLCVSAMTVVRPLLAQPDGSCWVVDAYGTWVSPPTTAPCSPEPGA
jgi:hypothetical protein